MSGHFGLRALVTDEQAERVEKMRLRLDSRFGTDAIHFVAPMEMFIEGIFRDERRAALAEVFEPGAQEMALAQVMAQGAWDSHAGRTCDFADLSVASQAVRCDEALRHFKALREFLGLPG